MIGHTIGDKSICGDSWERRGVAACLMLWVAIGGGCVVPSTSPAPLEPVAPITEPGPAPFEGRAGGVAPANGESGAIGGPELGTDRAAAAAKAAAHSAGEAALKKAGGGRPDTVRAPLTTSQRRLVREAKDMLNDWHLSAADADADVYLGHMALDAVFLGPDAEERWDMARFRSYVNMAFAANRAWSYAPFDRHVIVGGGGLDVAWFDERIDSGEFSGLRGTGVLRREGDAWKIVHYSLTYTIPFGIKDEVETAIKSASPPR